MTGVMLGINAVVLFFLLRKLLGMTKVIPKTPLEYLEKLKEVAGILLCIMTVGVNVSLFLAARIGSPGSFIEIAYNLLVLCVVVAFQYVF